MKKCFVFGILLFMFTGMSAQDGTPDPSFNATGWKSFSFGKAGNVVDDIGFSVLQQPDKKYIVLGVSLYGNIQLSRFNTDGTIDSSYGTEGFSDQTASMYGRNAVMQQDGKVLVVGYDYSIGYASAAIARFNTNGSLDNSFGTQGILSVAFKPDADSRGQAISIDLNGRIVMGGSVEYYDYEKDQYFNHFGIARFTAGGVLDNSFNSTGSLPGTAIINFGTDYAFLTAVAIQGDGKIVVGGSSVFNGHESFTLARFLSEGDQAGILDSSFGSGGIVVTAFGNSASGISALAIQDDNKIVAGGGVSHFDENTENYNYDIAVARYLADGTLDASFNVGSSFTGTVITDLGGDESIYSIVLKNNRITVAGVSQSYNPTDFTSEILLVSYQNDGVNDGSLDRSFGSGGIVETGFSEQDLATSVLVQSNGAIVITGFTSNSAVNNWDVLLVRFNSSGVLDPSFNATGAQPGVVTFYLPSDAPSRVSAIAVQPGGKIIVAGAVYLLNPGQEGFWFAVSRLNADGTPDRNFGYGGVAFASFGTNKDAIANAVFVAPGTGKITLGGFVNNYNIGNLDFALARFTKEGVLDNAFGTGGLVVTDFNSNDDEIYSLAIQEDGKIVTGGTSINYSNYGRNFIIVRYTNTGDLDVSFGSSGVATFDFPGYEDNIEAMTLDPAGQVVAVGGVFNSTSGNYDFALARLTVDGLPDKKFGKDGHVITRLPDILSIALAVAVQPDGKILASGFAIRKDILDSMFQVVIRYSAIGEPDKNFGDRGTVMFSFPGYIANSINGNSVVLQNDGKIIMTSQLQPAGNRLRLDVPAYLLRYGYGAARFTSSGESDNTWGTAGRLISDLPLDPMLYSSLWNNGRLYTVGELNRRRAPNAAAARSGAGFIAVYTAGERLPYISINDVVVNEAVGNAHLIVSMDKASTTPIMIKYATEDNTATSIGRYADYRVARGILTITPGTTTATINVDILADNQYEGPESFYLNLSLLNPMNDHAIIADSVGTVTITEGAAMGIDSRFTRLNNEVIAVGKLAVKAMPNPSTGAFNILLQSAVDAPVNIRIMDATGKLIESKEGIGVNRNILVGRNYMPGVYYAEVVQGNEKIVVRLVKQ